MPAEGLEPPTNGLQSTDREFCGLIFQPLAALASPVPRPTTAQLRHTQSGLGTFPAQGRAHCAQHDFPSRLLLIIYYREFSR
jgi:hypothetical protein